jgi:NTE family protein
MMNNLTFMMMYKRLLFFSIFLMGCHALYVPQDGQVFLPAFEPKKPIRIALVLGGGGSKGLAHLGAINELEKAGIRPDLVIGCSAGAIAGALYADNPQLGMSVQPFIRLKKADLLDYSFLKPLFGIVNGKHLQNFMKKNLRSERFEELKIPLILVATDLNSGEAVEFSSGDIASAVRASCAFPGIFKPVFLHGRYFIDGGAACPIPVSVAKKYGATVIIAIDLSEKLPKSAPRHLFGVTKRSLEIAYRKFVEQSLSQADIVVKMEFDEVGTFSDHLNESLYERGQVAVQSQLPDIQKKLASLLEGAAP